MLDLVSSETSKDRPLFRSLWSLFLVDVLLLQLFLIFLSLLLSKFVNHVKLSIFLSHELFGEFKVALQELFNREHETILRVLIDHKVVKCLLRIQIATQNERNQHKQTFLLDFRVLYFGYVLAKELNCANLNHRILLQRNNSLRMDPVVSVPVGSWCRHFFVFNFNDLSQQR